jgi:methionine synthase / methylenetetrahydrofolate reductase(NADPH)
MTRPSFLNELDKRVLVCDGAMGTMLYTKGVFLNRSFDELNLKQPDLVSEIHQIYVRHGADVIETNTFGANRVKLGVFGIADQVQAMNLQGARIAKHAARDQAWVAGSIGPLGIRIEPWGKTGVDEAESFFAEQARALAEGGVDLFVLETFRDLNEIGAAIRAVRSVCELPIVAQMTTEDDGNTSDGVSPETFVPALERFGADVVGLNCSVGPAPMLETIERLARVATVKLSAQPNAGKPREIEGRQVYLSSPDYMASYARRFIDAGVRLVGGCCGTTPEHIRHIKQAVRALSLTEVGPVGRAVDAGAARPRETAAPAVVARAEKSQMSNALARGKFVVSVELVPPRGYLAEELVEQARQLRIHGVDLVNIPDGPRATGRMSALAAAVMVEQRAGIETILHYACRDRNMIGMQSDLLGAHAMGIRNLLVITGDPPGVGDYPDATAVYEVDSIGLTNLVSKLNRGQDIGGQAIGQPTAFHIGVAANPGAFDVDQELRRFAYKVEAGAEFAITQPVFDVAALGRFLDRIGADRIPVLAAITPLESLRHAEFMANEVPGVTVPAETIDRMRRAEAAGRAREEGMTIARELVAELAGSVQGLQVTVPAGAFETAVGVLDAIEA